MLHPGTPLIHSPDHLSPGTPPIRSPDGAPMMTVHHKPERDLWVAAYAAPAGTEIELRTAPTPEGPWSDAETLHHARTPLGADTWVYGALLHPGLQRADGDYPTHYLADTGAIQLVEITWQ